MGPLIVQLIPVAIGVMLSPLAIMALVAVLLSRLRRVNGVAYLLGWATGIVGLLALLLWLFAVLDVHARREPPVWIAVVRISLGIVLIAGAVWIYRRSAARIRRMAAASSPEEVAAAATLPGWLQSVTTFRPVRTYLLGIALFVANPLDLSYATVAALDISLADITASQATAVVIAFAVVGALSIAIPVVLVLVRGEQAQPALEKVRRWIAGNTHVVNAAVLVFIGALQLDKGILALL